MSAMTDEHHQDHDYEDLSEGEVRELEDFAATLKTGYLQCRELNHRWEPSRVEAVRNGGFLRTLRCRRCGGRKHQEMTNRGMILRSWYEYPEGYLREGLGRIVGEGRGVLRVQSMLRGRIDIAKDED